VRSTQLWVSDPKSYLRCQSGFTLVELLIASVVLLIMMGGMLSVMRVSTSLNHSTEQGLDLQQNVRSAINLISRELINAGSGIPYSSAISGSPSITVPAGARLGPMGTALASGTVYFVTPGNSSGQQVTVDGEGNPLATAIWTDTLTFLGGMGESKFVKQTAPGPTSGWGAQVFLEDNSGFRPGQVALVTNGLQLSLGQITQVPGDGSLQFSNGDPLGLNLPGSGASPNPNYFAAQQAAGGPPSIVYPLSSISYFVDSATDPRHPMLKRVANTANGAATATAVADNIEDFQISYLVDSDADAITPSVAMDAPATNQISLIRGARITITGRSQIKMGDTNYTDRHSRLTMSQTVFFRNNVRR
jgi:type IV pilus assembly protein PilW